MSRQGLSALVLGSAALTGCTTANYTREDLAPHLSKDQIAAYSSRAAASPVASEVTPSSALSYNESQQHHKRYGGSLPSAAFTLYLVDARQTPAQIDVRQFNTTGPLNAAYADVERIEDSFSEGMTYRPRFSAGKPSKDTLVARSGRNQASSLDGVLGVDYATGNEQAQNFFIDMKQLSTFKGLREQDRYEVRVTFGTPAFRQVKKRTDIVYLVSIPEGAAQGALTGGIIAGGPGAAAGAAAGASFNAFDGLIAYFDGARAPQGSRFFSHRHYANLRPDTLLDTLSTLRQAADTGARSVIVFRGPEGTGVVYANNIESISASADSVQFTMSDTGAQHFKQLLVTLAQSAASAGIGAGVYRPDPTGPGAGSGSGGGGRTGQGSGGSSGSGGGRTGQGSGGSP